MKAEHASRRGKTAGATVRRADVSRPRISAFTLVEMLVVIAIIAVLTALLAPAMQGLMGTGGRRGGMNVAATIFEQARLAAIENGTTAYVGFPVGANNKTNAFSHMIVFRAAAPDRPGETNPIALTRWQRLPTGIFYELGPSLSGALTTVSSVPPRTFPKLGGSEEIKEISALAFNRFGQLQGATTEVSLFVGEKIDPAKAGGWLRSASNYFELRVQPLTGRVVIDDASATDQ